MMGDEYWTDQEQIVHIMNPDREIQPRQTMCGLEATWSSSRHRRRGCDRCVLQVSCALAKERPAL